jgi:hypothetical protein
MGRNSISNDGLIGLVNSTIDAFVRNVSSELVAERDGRTLQPGEALITQAGQTVILRIRLERPAGWARIIIQVEPSAVQVSGVFHYDRGGWKELSDYHEGYARRNPDLPPQAYLHAASFHQELYDKLCRTFSRSRARNSRSHLMPAITSSPGEGHRPLVAA